MAETVINPTTPRKAGKPLSMALLTGFALLLVAGYTPLLIRFAGEQWDRPQYQFFPLMIAAAVIIGWQRISEVPPGAMRASSGKVSAAILGLALLLFVAAGALWSGRVAAVSLWLALAGVIWSLGGRAAARALAPSGILLALVIGPPVGSDEGLLQSLRSMAVSVSAGVLMILDVPHMVTGTIIEIKGSRLLVAEACSGINSLMAVLGCTLVLGFWRRRSPRVIIFLLLAGVMFVLWANVIRIAGGAWLKAGWGIDLLSGDAHEMASVALFTVCMVLVLSTDEALAMLKWLLATDDLPPIEVQIAAAPSGTPDAAPTVRPARITGGLWAAAAFFLAIGMAQVGVASANGGLRRWLAEPAAAHLKGDAIFTVPMELGGWKRSPDIEKLIALPELIGKKSEAWAYQGDGMTVVVAIDYPFAGYHDLTLCYRNAGWTVSDHEIRRDTTGVPGVFAAFSLTGPNGRGYVWYSALNEQGAWAERPKDSALGRLADRLSHVGRPDWQGATYQVQLFVQTFEPLDKAQAEHLQQLFTAARNVLAPQVMSQLEGAR